MMRMMATGGPLGLTDECRETKRRCTEEDRDVERKFRYTCPYDWHFRYRHAVDDHNNLRHATPAVEDSWLTHRWECRVFHFSWLFSKSMHSLHCGTLCSATTRLKDVRCSSSSVADWLGSSYTTLDCARRSGRLLPEPLQPPFTSSSLPRLMLESGREELGYVMRSSSTSSTSAR